VKLSSHEGRQRLLSVLSKGLADAYWTLTEHSINQSDPAYCGLTTLVMVLNSMSVDPQIRWRGGWRYFGDEDVLLSRCCLNPERVRRIGITLEEFQQLARCQGLSVKLKRPDRETNTLEHFRNDIRQLLLQPSKSVLVVSYSRPALGQTGDGHFSPVAAYHEETDSVLVLDVARFKYPPYFVSVPDLYNAMIPLDQASQKSRGWFVMTPPRVSASYHDPDEEDEHLRPASLVPAVGDADVCPVAKVKVEFCKSRTSNRQNNNLSKQELSSSGSLFSNR
jgi:glutathione gamma-glutamylcysteinyltransferase